MRHEIITISFIYAHVKSTTAANAIFSREIHVQCEMTADRDNKPNATAVCSIMRIPAAHSRPQPPAIAHSRPQRPTVAHSRPQPPTVAHSCPQPPTIAHSRPLVPWVAHGRPRSPTVAHRCPRSPTLAHSRPQPPTAAHWCPRLHFLAVPYSLDVIGLGGKVVSRKAV